MNQDFRSMKAATKLIVIFSIAILGYIPLFVSAQKTEAIASIDSNNVLIGDQVRYTYKFTFPSKAIPSIPVIADTITKQIEVISRLKMDTLISADKKYTTL